MKVMMFNLLHCRVYNQRNVNTINKVFSYLCCIVDKDHNTDV